MNPAIFLVRFLQCAFIISVLLFIYVLHIVHPAPHSVNASLQWGIVFCAIASALVGFYVQRMLLRFPNQPLSATQGSNLLRPWFTGHLLRFATAESVALFGFLLRMLGSSSILVTVLFMGGLLLLLLWQPGAIPTETASHSSAG
jgi:hypothetical protein